MEIDKEKVSRDLKSLKSSMEVLSKESSALTPSNEQLLGLAFERGEEVKDRVTGKRGKIIAGERAYIVVSVPGEKGGGSVPSGT